MQKDFNRQSIKRVSFARNKRDNSKENWTYANAGAYLIYENKQAHYSFESKKK